MRIFSAKPAAAAAAFALLVAGCGDDSGPDLEAYCDLAEQQNTLVDEFDEFTDPEALEGFVAELNQLLDDALEVAPDEVVDDLEIVDGDQGTIAEILEENDWDIAASFEEVEAIGQDDEASDRVDEFSAEECGIEIDDDDAADAEAEVAGAATDDTTTDEPATDAGDEALAEALLSDPETLAGLLATESGRDAFIEGLTESSELSDEQAGCFVDNADPEFLSNLGSGDPTGADATTLFELADLCDIPAEFLGG